MKPGARGRCSRRSLLCVLCYACTLPCCATEPRAHAPAAELASVTPSVDCPWLFAYCKAWWLGGWGEINCRDISGVCSQSEAPRGGPALPAVGKAVGEGVRVRESSLLCHTCESSGRSGRARARAAAATGGGACSKRAGGGGASLTSHASCAPVGAGVFANWGEGRETFEKSSWQH